MSRSNAIASIAPSAALAETPSVNGVASGLRSSACSTTPAAASVEPTSAPASTRGSRATKKICASTLSAHGIDGSKTRAQADRRAARASARSAGPRSVTGANAGDDDRASSPPDCVRSALARACGHAPTGHRRRDDPLPAWQLHVGRRRRTAAGRCRGVSTSAVGPAAMHPSVAQQHQLVAHARRRGSDRASRSRW